MTENISDILWQLYLSYVWYESNESMNNELRQQRHVLTLKMSDYND